MSDTPTTPERQPTEAPSRVPAEASDSPPREAPALKGGGKVTPAFGGRDSTAEHEAHDPDSMDENAPHGSNTEEEMDNADYT